MVVESKTTGPLCVCADTQLSICSLWYQIFYRERCIFTNYHINGDIPSKHSIVLWVSIIQHIIH